jgi:hypothetical protein
MKSHFHITILESAASQVSPATQTNEMLQCVMCQHDGATAHGTYRTQVLLRSFHQELGTVHLFVWTSSCALYREPGE